MKLSLIIASLFLPAIANAECSVRSMTDRITDRNGSEVISTSSKTVCGEGNPTLDKLVGIDSTCYHPRPDDSTLACQYPNGNWVLIGEVEAFDVISGPALPVSGQYSTNTRYADGPVSTVTLLTNFARWTAGNLDSRSTEIHNAAVFVALDKSKNGELIEWANPLDKASGKIKVVQTSFQQGNYCRAMLMQISKNGNSRNLKETACFDDKSKSWRFPA